MAALYPFARDHNDYDSKSQEPYALGDTVLGAAHTSLKLRYSLLKHYYTLFISKRGMGSIFKPLFFAFPSDENLYVDEICNTQFMLGFDLLATPIVEPNVTSRDIYLPELKWYDFYTGKLYEKGHSKIENISLTDKVPMFIREGAAVLIQDTEYVLQTKDLGNVFHLVGGFHFDSKRSTDQIKYYSASMAHMSIKDYNDE
jgi:alpha-glucosidase